MARSSTALKLIGVYLAIVAALVLRSIVLEVPLAAPPAPPAPPCRRNFLQKLFHLTPPECKAVRGAKHHVMKPAKAASASSADSLMRKRTVGNCLAAADIYEEAAEGTTGDADAAALRLKAAVTAARFEPHAF